MWKNDCGPFIEHYNIISIHLELLYKKLLILMKVNLEASNKADLVYFVEHNGRWFLYVTTEEFLTESKHYPHGADAPSTCTQSFLIPRPWKR